MWHGWDMGFGWGDGRLMGGLVMLLFWSGVIALAFFAVRALTRTGGGRSQGDSPLSSGESALDILQKRYARGEIGREEYLQMKRDLET